MLLHNNRTIIQIFVVILLVTLIACAPHRGSSSSDKRRQDEVCLENIMKVFRLNDPHDTVSCVEFALFHSMALTNALPNNFYAELYYKHLLPAIEHRKEYRLREIHAHNETENGVVPNFMDNMIDECKPNGKDTMTPFQWCESEFGTLEIPFMEGWAI